MCPACDPRQYATAFNQPLSWDTSGVTDMRYMFDVRCSLRPLHPKLQSRPHSCTRRLHRDRAPYTRGRPLARRPSLYPVRPPCDSAARTLPLRRQQAAHPLRVGGHPRLRLRGLWLELGAGKLPLKPSPRGVRAAEAESMAAACTTARNLCVEATPTPT